MTKNIKIARTITVQEDNEMIKIGAGGKNEWGF